MANRTIHYIIWGPLIILLLIGLIAPPFPNFTPSGIYASGWLSAGLFSSGILSAGLFSAGVFSAGLFSVGIFSVGVFSLGIFSFGTFVLGIWASGQFVKSCYKLNEQCQITTGCCNGTRSFDS
jgi:quaternary ammonium compound-resistance protein SugE